MRHGATPPRDGWRAEGFLGIRLATCIAFTFFAPGLEARLSNPIILGLVLVWLFTAILGSSISVVRHGEQIAVRLGEPYGTLVLTLAVTVIEVMSISAVMLHGKNNPTLLRDTLIA